MRQSLDLENYCVVQEKPVMSTKRSCLPATGGTYACHGYTLKGCDGVDLNG